MAATPDQIAALRALINEPDDSNGWDDDTLGDLIDAQGTVNGAASVAWTAKAASFSSLVDVSESGSSRKLGDLHKNAMTMAKHFGELAEEVPVGTSDGPVIHRIRRTFA